MSVFFPKFRLNLLPAMLWYALVGAAIAGLYGVIHDQITYSISPEYFSRLKFIQFHYANLGLPPRIFAAEIGFLATWWVGFIAGWLLARVAVPVLPPQEARVCCNRGFLIMLGCTLTASFVGFGLGLLRGGHSDSSAWRLFAFERGIVDLPRFVQVAYIHNAGYLGGLIGLIIALVDLRWSTRQKREPKAAL